MTSTQKTVRKSPCGLSRTSNTGTCFGSGKPNCDASATCSVDVHCNVVYLQSGLLHLSVNSRNVRFDIAQQCGREEARRKLKQNNMKIKENDVGSKFGVLSCGLSSHPDCTTIRNVMTGPTNISVGIQSANVIFRGSYVEHARIYTHTDANETKRRLCEHMLNMVTCVIVIYSRRILRRMRIKAPCRKYVCVHTAMVYGEQLTRWVDAARRRDIAMRRENRTHARSSRSRCCRV